MRLLRFSLLLMALVWGTALAQGDCTDNESWLQIGSGLPGAVEAAAESSGSLYAVYVDPQDPRTRTLALWNGALWSDLVTFTTNGYATSVAAYGGDVYIGGYFLTVDNQDAGGLLRWDGSNLSSIGTGLNGTNGGRVQTLLVADGKLFIGGYFQSIDGVTASSVAMYDGTTFQQVGDGLTGGQGSPASISHLSSFEGDVIAVGGIDGHGSTSGTLRSIARWNGTSWSWSGDTPDYANYATTFDGDLVVVGFKVKQGREGARILSFDGTSWSEVGTSTMNMATGHLAEHGGRLFSFGYSTIRDSIFFDTVGSIRAWNGTEWELVSGLNGGITTAITSGANLYIFGGFTSSCGSEVLHAARICDDGNCSRISGTIFNDVNGNCASDNGEIGLPRRVVEITPGPFYAITGEDGSYARFVEPGSYTVLPSPHAYWSLPCHTSGTSVTVANPGEVATGVDFAALPEAGIRDLRVSLAGSTPRPGRQVVYTIRYENVGTEPISGSLYFEHDAELSVDSAVAPAANMVDRKLEWQFEDLPVGTFRTIRVYASLPRTTERGTLLCNALWSELQQVDALLSDNRDTLCDTVRASYDPNDISVTPVGTLQSEYLTLAPHDTVLTYQIRFQNTGNDTAFTIVVVDTLAPALDIRTLKAGASSHPYELEIGEGGELRFVFNDIMLPDSFVNEIGSHGYVRYTVRLREGLDPFTLIENRAGIYFDFNPVVLTNSVYSLTSGVSSVPTERPNGPSVRLLPNPATTRAEITADGPGRLTLRSMRGESLLQQSIDASGRATIDLSSVPAGVYLVSVETAGGTANERLVIVR